MVSNITEALFPFLSNPHRSFYQRELSLLTSIPRPTLRGWLIGLEKEGIIDITPKGKITFYSLNFRNPLLLETLVIAEKTLLSKQCEKSLMLIELKDYLIKNFDGTIILFGSATDSIEDANDIDIISTGKVDNKKITYISEKLGKRIHLINVKILEKISSALKNEAIKKHLLIKNSEDALRWMLWQE